MLMLTMMNDIALKFKSTVRILFIFSQIIVLTIRIRPISKDPLFGIALVTLHNIFLALKGHNCSAYSREYFWFGNLF